MDNLRETPKPAGPAAVRQPASAGDQPIGFVYAIGAYGLWGMMPFYVKAVAHIPALEIVAYRVLWSVPVAGIVILALRRTADLRAALQSPRTMLLATVTALLVSINWLVYVWAVSVDRALETALGYYINPLINVLMGAVFLGERFTRAQIMAVALAVVGVAVMTIETGGLPWISLVLACSFASYGFLRKTLPIGPTQGFMLEVMILSPLAFVVVLWFAIGGGADLAAGMPPALYAGSDQGAGRFWLLALAGPVTAFPLILYAFGAKALRYSTIGLLQYIAPTLIFLIAVFVFREPFSAGQLVAFLFIWSAVILYSWSLIRR